MAEPFEVDFRQPGAAAAAQVTAIAGLILAAGASRRMGVPKANLDYRGETFLNRLIRILGEVSSPVVVVLGPDAGPIRETITRPAEFVVNPEPERGQLTSLQCGLRAIPAAARAVMFTPLDYPAVEPSTVHSLADAWRPDVPLILPRHAGRRGHPVLLGAGLIPEFLALPESATARDVVRRHAAQYVDVDDAGVVTDVDTPEDYRRLLEIGERASL